MKILTARLLKLFAALLLMQTIPSLAQVREIDPNDPPAAASASAAPDKQASSADLVAGPIDSPMAMNQSTSSAADPAAAGQTYRRDDVIAAAEGVFGKGAKGLADIIEKVLRDQGEPNAYIVGREASGAVGIGLRYGSGTMTHSVEGQRPVYWTGPSLGFDLGGDATKTFVLVYNLYDSQDLYRRYPQVEGRAYFIGGFSATYLRRGNVALIPVRAGVGARLGANIGYMKFSEKSRWLPF